MCMPILRVSQLYVLVKLATPTDGHRNAHDGKLPLIFKFEPCVCEGNTKEPVLETIQEGYQFFPVVKLL